MKSKYKLGAKVKHKLKRFKGIVTAIVFYDTGLISYNIQSKQGKKDWVEEIHLK